ncbi:hypothetical protein [Bordetella muralis]|uniref:hypothetical protein n=1 Tax=Bordetella muralis TaxID=1649130 RepID=UPI0039EE107D
MSMAENNLVLELTNLLQRYSRIEVEQTLRGLSTMDRNSDVCTILVNQGLHSFPDYVFRGEKYVFYEGSADLSSSEALADFAKERLEGLAKFLKQRKWSEVYIVISGQAALCMLIKLAVYRITHIETTDWVFDGRGNYISLKLPLRSILTSSST